MRRLLLIPFGVLVLGARGVSAAPACDKDTGITLPPGFCATVFADDLGTARHMVAGSDGVLYVALQSEHKGGAIVALRDSKGSGHADQVVHFGSEGGSGIVLHGGYVYFATPTAVLRYKLPVAADSKPETVVGGFPPGRARRQEHRRQRPGRSLRERRRPFQCLSEARPDPQFPGRDALSAAGGARRHLALQRR